MPSLGESGQARLKEATVVIAGTGGLGCTVSLFLAYAGVGRLKLIDYDTVQLSNLNRQILFTEADIGLPKAPVAAKRLSSANPWIKIEPIGEKISQDNARSLIANADVVIDAFDNMDGRFILNKACVAENKPLVHAGVRGLTGQVTTILPGKTPCLACLLPTVPIKDAPPPVFGVTPGLLATIQATEALKLIAGIGNVLAGHLLIVNLETMEFNKIAIRRRPGCPVCT